MDKLKLHLQELPHVQGVRKRRRPHRLLLPHTLKKQEPSRTRMHMRHVPSVHEKELHDRLLLHTRHRNETENGHSGSRLERTQRLGSPQRKETIKTTFLLFLLFHENGRSERRKLVTKFLKTDLLCHHQRLNAGSEATEARSFSAASSCSLVPLMASQQLPSAPQTPPPAIISAIAPVKRCTASISVNT
jgi:hypothetical protein